MEAYEKGLALDPDSSELREEKQRTLMAINTGEADPERAKEAMKDPEIQQILRDPTINKVLGDLQQNPAAGQAAMKDKDIRAKIEKVQHHNQHHRTPTPTIPTDLPRALHPPHYTSHSRCPNSLT